MLLIGLTGNIAAGKSTVAAALVARGAALIDSDVAARDAVAPGTPALARIVARFGADMLRADGSLDRAKLGARVFADATERQALEAIVHPAVEAVRQSAVAKARNDGHPVTICDIPLLFEARLAWQFPRIILVDAPAAARVARLVHDRGMAQAAALARVQAQLPAPLKRPRADLIIDNDCELSALHDQIDRAWTRIMRWATVAESNRAA
jgi:dephospho-CoA kinase